MTVWLDNSWVLPVTKNILMAKGLVVDFSGQTLSFPFKNICLSIDLSSVCLSTYLSSINLFIYFEMRFYAAQAGLDLLM